MLARIVDERWFALRAVVGFWLANAVGDDDIELYGDAGRTSPCANFRTLRQQMYRTQTRPNFALADFVAPADSGVADWLGGFVVTVGSVDPVAQRFEAAHDDYSAIMVKALADRLAEAFAERMHQRMRTEFWGYAGDEALSNDELIAEAYRGIRPAPGYPACPEHSEKRVLFDLLDAEAQTGVVLTENFAMWPASSVSGFYFSHRDAQYFGVGRIERDQVEDYARRKGWPVGEAERWLASSLNYDPADHAATDAAA